MAWEVQKKPRLLIGTPIRPAGDVKVEWAIGYRQLIIPQELQPHIITFQNQATVDLARNNIVDVAFNEGVEYILFYDSDVIPPADALIKLYESKLPIVSALYYRRHPVRIRGQLVLQPHPSIWKKISSEQQKPGEIYQPIVELPQGQLIEADVIGLGFCLVHIDVFKRMNKPWFKFLAGWHKFDPSVDWRDEKSEDFYWCDKARELGYKIYVRTDIQCRHVFEGVVDGKGSITYLIV